VDLDLDLLLWINQGWAHPVLDLLFPWVSKRSTFSFPLLGLLLALFLWRFGRDGLRLWLMLIVAVYCGDLLGALLKDIAAQPRPCTELFDLLRDPVNPGAIAVSCGAKHSGMPSNHALNFFSTAAFLFIATRSWQLGVPLLVIAILVSLSRIYLGVHFPSQVVAGALLGLLYGSAVAWLAGRYLGFMRNIVRVQSSGGKMD
jgi:undecaprenyl-diphosphatase